MAFRTAMLTVWVTVALACLPACSAGTARGTEATSSPTCPPRIDDFSNAGQQLHAVPTYEPRTIGVSIPNCEADFYRELVRSMTVQAASSGYRLDVRDAERDDTTQQDDVADFIERGAAAIVLTPHDSASRELVDVVARANGARVPVFTTDIALRPGPMELGAGSPIVVSHIASENAAGGRKAAKLLCEAVERHGDVAIIDQRFYSITSVDERVAAFRDELGKRCPSVHVVNDIDTGGEIDKARAALEDVLQEHPNLAGVFAINDDAALGAAAAVANSVPHVTIPIVGFDAMQKGRAAVDEGTIDAEVVQYPQQMGTQAIKAVADHLAGRRVPATIAIPVATVTSRPRQPAR
jgi:ribose transport system substrate-binding protein